MECQAITLEGIQCSRNAEPEFLYCWQHQNYEEQKNKTSEELLTELMNNLTTYDASTLEQLRNNYKAKVKLENSNHTNSNTFMRERPITSSSPHIVTSINGAEYINGLPLIPEIEFKSAPLAQNNLRSTQPNFAYGFLGDNDINTLNNTRTFVVNELEDPNSNKTIEVTNTISSPNFELPQAYKLRGSLVAYIPSTKSSSPRRVIKPKKTKTKPENYIPKSTDKDFSSYMD